MQAYLPGRRLACVIGSGRGANRVQAKSQSYPDKEKAVSEVSHATGIRPRVVPEVQILERYKQTQTRPQQVVLLA